MCAHKSFALSWFQSCALEHVKCGIIKHQLWLVVSVGCFPCTCVDDARQYVHVLRMLERVNPAVRPLHTKAVALRCVHLLQIRDEVHEMSWDSALAISRVLQLFKENGSGLMPDGMLPYVRIWSCAYVTVGLLSW